MQNQLYCVLYTTTCHRARVCPLADAPAAAHTSQQHIVFFTGLCHTCTFQGTEYERQPSCIGHSHTEGTVDVMSLFRSQPAQQYWAGPLIIGQPATPRPQSYEFTVLIVPYYKMSCTLNILQYCRYSKMILTWQVSWQGDQRKTCSHFKVCLPWIFACKILLYFKCCCSTDI